MYRFLVILTDPTPKVFLPSLFSKGVRGCFEIGQGKLVQRSGMVTLLRRRWRRSVTTIDDDRRGSEWQRKRETRRTMRYRRDDPIIVPRPRGSRVYIHIYIRGSKKRLHGEERRQDQQWGSARSGTVRSCDEPRASRWSRSRAPGGTNGTLGYIHTSNDALTSFYWISDIFLLHGII